MTPLVYEPVPTAESAERTGAAAAINITPAMISAGVAALSEDADLFFDCGGRPEIDGEIVSDIYLAMVTAEGRR
jgi:hypothetical protein